jgi:hypothetical protein
MTNIKLDLYDLLVQALGGQIAHIPATVDVSELLEFNDIHACEQDLAHLLHDNRMVAHVWTVNDVRELRPDLNDDQAWTVLMRVNETAIRVHGIIRDDLERTAYDLFGTSAGTRVERCDTAIAGYGDDLPESNLIDFLADAMHWCEAKEHDFDRKLELARVHFTTEISGE